MFHLLIPLWLPKSFLLGTAVVGWLELNPSKMEVMWLGRAGSIWGLQLLALDGLQVSPMDSIKSFSLWLDVSLSLDKQLSTVARSAAFFYLRQACLLTPYQSQSVIWPQWFMPQTLSYWSVEIHSMRGCHWRCSRSFRLFKMQLLGFWPEHHGLHAYSQYWDNCNGCQMVSVDPESAGLNL